MLIPPRQRKWLVLKTTWANFELYDEYIWKKCCDVAKHQEQVDPFSLLTKPCLSLKHSANVNTTASNPARKKLLILLE